ncbi:MAG: 3-dehydroquinate synthase [bacterium]|nr:3-dehydroquinate synthase [bacterium]
MTACETPVQVNLGSRSYYIHVAASFEELPNVLAPLVEGRRCAVVSNPTVWGLYGGAVSEAIVAAGGTPVAVLMPDGEEYKTLSVFERVMEDCVTAGLDRSSVILGLGGGVVGDMAGFAAASYMRGIGLVHLPTTLLAQVDSAIGGKTGVNLVSGKNLVGAFYQPRAVYINWKTLASLPEREMRAGFAEVIKYGMIADAALWELLEETTAPVMAAISAHAPLPEVVGEIIRRCCEIKAGVVAADECESGVRAILNYGHTFAHAIETLTRYRTYVHGEAVAIGMHAAATYAHALGLCSAELVARQRAVIEAAGLPTRLPRVNVDELMAAFARDKKARGGSLTFILPEAIGRVKVVHGCDESLLRSTLTALQA